MNKLSEFIGNVILMMSVSSFSVAVPACAIDFFFIGSLIQTGLVHSSAQYWELVLIIVPAALFPLVLLLAFSMTRHDNSQVNEKGISVTKWVASIVGKSVLFAIGSYGLISIT
jgi:hypothetical protein